MHLFHISIPTNRDAVCMLENHSILTMMSFTVVLSEVLPVAAMSDIVKVLVDGKEVPLDRVQVKVFDKVVEWDDIAQDALVRLDDPTPTIRATAVAAAPSTEDAKPPSKRRKLAPINYSWLRAASKDQALKDEIYALTTIKNMDRDERKKFLGPAEQFWKEKTGLPWLLWDKSLPAPEEGIISYENFLQYGNCEKCHRNGPAGHFCTQCTGGVNGLQFAHMFTHGPTLQCNPKFVCFLAGHQWEEVEADAYPAPRNEADLPR